MAISIPMKIHNAAVHSHANSFVISYSDIYLSNKIKIRSILPHGIPNLSTTHRVNSNSSGFVNPCNSLQCICLSSSPLPPPYPARSYVSLIPAASSSSSFSFGLSYSPSSVSLRKQFICRVDKREAARNALEQALGGNKDKWDRWNDEIAIREKIAAGGGNGEDGKNGSGGEGGGGRWGGWGYGGENWKEIKETLLAIGIILLIFLVVTQGSKIVALCLNCFVIVIRKIRGPETDTAHENGRAPHGRKKTQSAEDRVTNKWGSD